MSTYNLNMVVRGTPYQPKQTKKIEQKCKTLSLSLSLSLVSYIIIHKYMPPRVAACLFFFWHCFSFKGLLNAYTCILACLSFIPHKDQMLYFTGLASTTYTLLSLNQHLLKPHVFQGAPKDTMFALFS